MIKATNIKWDIDYDDNGFLPTEVEISTGMTDAEEISDWLSNEFGYCHEGFYLEMEEE